ncbi:ComF family protein, partial [Treponema sp. R6D11]
MKCNAEITIDDKSTTKCKSCGTTRRNYLLPCRYFKYDGRVKEAILRLKFSSALDHAKTIAELMAANIRLLEHRKFDIIAPMPISRKRLN